MKYVTLRIRVFKRERECMKNRVIRNFLIFLGCWFLIVIGVNITQQQPILTNFPWEILLIFLLSLILVVTELKRKTIWGIYFIVFFIYMLLNGGYYNWTSLITFAFMSFFMSAITYFIGVQFKKGGQVK